MKAGEWKHSVADSSKYLWVLMYIVLTTPKSSNIQTFIISQTEAYAWEKQYVLTYYNKAFVSNF